MCAVQTIIVLYNY